MAIIRLPDTTRRLLSSMSIPSPNGLVKELLDNAIDAQATSIEVLISPNTIDKIEVRDNGVGIHPGDSDSLGRSGHTSKLRSYEGLDVASSTTLGFRGEALASARKLAAIRVTTRRAEDKVAKQLEIDPVKGGILRQSATSAPCGTTVCATQLFSKLEVRAKCAVKDATKTLADLKELLVTYAMARPSLRLSLTVIGNSQSSWRYSPRPEASAKEAILQLFGSDCLSACCERTIKAPFIEMTDDFYTLEAYLISPKRSSFSTKMHNSRFISVDGRPLAAKKGPMKKLVAIYKKHIMDITSKLSIPTPVELFMRLNIKCPPGSYDANIEPAKDDVVFVHEQFLLDQFEALCTALYGAQSSPPEVHPGVWMVERSLDGITTGHSTRRLPPTRETHPRSHESHYTASPPPPPPRAYTPETSPIQLVQPRCILNMADDHNEPLRWPSTNSNGTRHPQISTPSQSRVTPGVADEELPILRPMNINLGDLRMPPAQCLTADNHQSDTPVPVNRYPPALAPPNVPMPQANPLTRRRQPLPPWTPPSSAGRPFVQRQRQQPAGDATQSTISFGEGGRPEIRSNASTRLNLETALSPVTSVVHNPPFVPVRPALVGPEGHDPPTDVLLEVPEKTTLDTSDPRAYLLRRQKSLAMRPHKIRRLKSAMLPLEIIPTNEQLHDLSHVVIVDLPTLCSVMRSVEYFDQYVVRGANGNGLDMDVPKARIIEEKLRHLVPDAETTISLVSVLQMRFATQVPAA